MKDVNTDFIAYRLDNVSLEDKQLHKNEYKDKIIKIQLFSKDDLFGSYFSGIYKGKLRIHIVFNQDSDEFKEEILDLIQDTFQAGNGLGGKVWFGNHNDKMIEYLKKHLSITADSEKFCYESHEMIMPRDKYHYKFDETLLEVRPFEEEHMDDYLRVLYHSMSFKIPPYNYILEKESFLKEFRELKEKHAFEAFWKNNDLVGLYWLGGTEVDHLAVSENYQRLGYGKQILSRAIEVLFENPEVKCAWLLVVGWNSKAYDFYKKFGMEEKAAYFVPYGE